jgi:hypothetical protein
VGGRPGVQDPAVMPAASAKMSLRPSAIWRSSRWIRLGCGVRRRIA